MGGGLWRQQPNNDSSDGETSESMWGKRSFKFKAC
jgi:hypothetical protein